MRSASPDGCPTTRLIITIPNNSAGKWFQQKLSSDSFDLFASPPESLADALGKTKAGFEFWDGPFHFLRVQIPFGRTHEVAEQLRALYQREDPDGPPPVIEEDQPGAFDAIGPFAPGDQAPTYLAEMGVAAAHAANAKGAGLTIAILDSGLTTRHPGNMWDATQGPARFVHCSDLHGHGTAMHGLVDAVAPDASLTAIRVCERENDLSIWGVLIGLYVASVDVGADIISMSFGFSNMHKYCPNCGGTAAMRSFALETAVMDAANRRGAQGRRPILVAATGNRARSDIQSKTRRELIKSPANFDSVVAVGSVDQSYDLSLFSNYDSAASKPRHFMGFGGQVDQMAKPLETLGLLNVHDACYGTSPATALVAGMLALLWSDARYQAMGREAFLDAVEQSHCVITGGMSQARFGKGVICWDPNAVAVP